MVFKKYFYNNFRAYPTPINLNYAWVFGSLLTLTLGLQVISGIFIACYYIPTEDHALNSILFLIRDVSGGWLAHRLHVIGSSLLFMLTYAHLGRAVYYKLFTWEYRYSWWSGYTLYILLTGTAFFGYILPWGQMSYWAATVIFNMFTIIPGVGKWLSIFIWGGLFVNTYTLQRIYIFHLLLSLMITAIAGLHLSIVHSGPFNTLYMTPSLMTPQSSTSQSSTLVKVPELLLINLYPYYIVKDFVCSCLILWIITIVGVGWPEVFSNYVNWVHADPMVTPVHIIPEWYLIPFYGLIKLIPSKVGGVLLMVGILMVPLVFPIVFPAQKGCVPSFTVTS